MPDGGVDIRALQPAAATRATAQALVDGAFRLAASLSIMSAGMPIPCFQTDKFAAAKPIPARQLAAVKERPGIWRSVGGRWRRPSSY